MFHDSLLDKDESGNVYEDGVTVLPTDTNEDGMVSAYNVYELDAEGNIVLDEEGNKVVKEIIKENATNSGTRLPNVYDETYVDVLDENGDPILNEDGTKKKTISKNLYDTKIEIYSATATDGTELDVDTAFAAPQDDTTGFDRVDDRNYNYVLLDEYKNYEASETQLEKYSRSYSHIDVVTNNLSYDISTVSEDSTGLVGRYCQYAQGFKNISFDAGDNTCKSITFKVTFDFLGRSDRMSANTVATETSAREDGRYCGDNQVQLGLSYILTLTPDSESAIAGFENTISDYRKSNFHIHFYNTTSKETDVISSGKDYTVYQGYCGNCRNTASGYSAPMIAPGFVADSLADSADNATDGVGRYYFHNYKNIYGFNVVYEKDGTLSVNIHFDEYKTGDTFVIGLSDGTKTKYSEFTIANPDASFFATVEYWDEAGETVIERDVRALRNSAKMVTIKGLSAKDIDTKLYIARMGNDGAGTKQIGRTHVFSLADYCMKVINEQDVYYFKDETISNTNDQYGESDEAEKQNDKNVAAALINYGKAAKAALEQGYDGIFAPTDKTVYWDGETYTKPTTTDSDGNILINNAEELAYIALKATATETKGNSYKVADNIANIILQPEDVVDGNTLMNLTDNAEVADYLTSLEGVVSWKATGKNCFNGNFDGNGVSIYGLYSNEGAGSGSTCGLFPFADGGVGRESDGLYQYKHVALQDSNKEEIFPAEVITMGEYVVDNTGITIKNVALKNSYMNTGWRVGAFVGYTYPAYSYTNKLISNSNDDDGSTTYDLDRSCTTANNAGNHVVGTINLEGCTLANCYITNCDSNASNKGVLLGAISDENYHISNCLVYGNYTVASSKNLNPVGGFTPHWVNNNLSGTRIWASIENTIYLDSVLHDGKAAWNSNTINSYENVYTNTAFAVNSTDGIFTYADTDVAAITTDKVLGNAAIENMPNLDWSKWSYGAVGSYPTPASENAVVDTESKISYYSGTPAKSFSDPIGTGETADSPIIINSADELAYLVGKVNLSGKYYKIADDIDIMVLQPLTTTNVNSLLNFSTAKQVSDYFENEAVTPTSWVTPSTVFTGNFDGNGVMIYGLYYDQTTTADGMGLFPRVDGGSVIKNVTVRNSYISSAKKQGAIAGMTYAISAGAKVAGLVTIEKCAVINCYMRAAVINRQDAGVVIGNTNGDYLKINNCLVYGNDAYSDYFKNNLGLLANLADPSEENVNSVTNSLAIGTAPYPTLNYSYNALDPTRTTVFGNVYTDQPGGKVTLYNYSGADTTSNKATFDYGSSITNIDAETIKGENGAELVEKLNTTDTPVWYVGAIDGYPSFSEVPALMTDMLDDYAAITFDYDQYGASTTEFGLYATSLNLKVNPYMSFTFAFHGDHKTDRQNISVTFTTDDGKVYTASKIPAYTGEDITNIVGWTNRYPAGRYHLYRLTDIDVIDLCKGITINATHGSDAFEAKVSVGGFVLDLENAYKADPCEYYSTRIEAAKALLFYTQMVNARYGA